MSKVKNTYISYNKLLELLHPYFDINGGEDILEDGEISMLINVSIQDVINNTSFSFMNEFEVIEEYEDYKGYYNIFYTKYSINKINEIIIDGVDNISILNTRMPKTNNDSEVYLKTGTNMIYVNKDIKSIAISYEREFEINNLTNQEEKEKPLPIPFKFVPALLKLIYDQSSILTFIEGEGNSTDYFGHYINRIKKLESNDGVSNSKEIVFK